MHPFNGIYSSWIDDKLTLKYILNGTELHSTMPEYYFQINNCDNILPLSDYPATDDNKISIDSLIQLLNEKNL